MRCHSDPERSQGEEPAVLAVITAAGRSAAGGCLVPKKTSTLAFQLLNLTSLRKQRHACHADEQAMFYYAWHVAQFSRQVIRIADLTKSAIENVVVLVRDVWCPVGIPAKLHGRAKGRDSLCHERLREPDHLYRQRKLSQPLNSLRCIRHNDQLLRRRRHNLFPKSRSAAAFDQSQFRIDFIRSVNRDVDLLTIVQRDDRNAQAPRQFLRPNGSRNAANAQAVLHLLAQ